MTGLPAAGLRELPGLVPPLLAPPGDERGDFDPEVPPPDRRDPKPVLVPVPVPVPVLVPVFVVVPVPEADVDERRFPVVFDSSNLTSWPTTKLFVLTKFTIHSGISPLLLFCLAFFSCFGDEWPAERFPGLFGAPFSWSVYVEGGVGVPGLKNSIVGTLCFPPGDRSPLLPLSDRNLPEGLTTFCPNRGLPDLPKKRPEKGLGSRDMPLFGLP